MRCAAAVLGALVWTTPSGGVLARLNVKCGTVSFPSYNTVNFTALFPHNVEPNSISSSPTGACGGVISML